MKAKKGNLVQSGGGATVPRNSYKTLEWPSCTCVLASYSLLRTLVDELVGFGR